VVLKSSAEKGVRRSAYSLASCRTEVSPASVCIVLHIAPDSPSLLARILSRAGKLPCHAVEQGEPLRNGEILVAPLDRHLVVDDEHVNLSNGPRENGHRPAVNVLFRSAAQAKGVRVVGVILSGTQEDGAAGLAAIKARGGITVVQDPTEARYAGMPKTALAQVAVDAVVPSERIASTIVAMVRGEAGAMPRVAENEVEPSMSSESSA
jgi:two-component system, chemotaxis family, protein-glutamate methylesterase/glutaminase